MPSKLFLLVLSAVLLLGAAALWSGHTAGPTAQTVEQPVTLGTYAKP